MKNILRYFVVAAVSALFFVSCTTEQEFNKEFLYGTWHTKTYPGFEGDDFYETYNRNGGGTSRNASEDVDSQTFKWILSGETLTREECMETTGGCDLPYDYRVTKLTETSLVYTRSGKTYSWTKAD